MHRSEILKKASDLTCGDRNLQYGEPGPQMAFAETMYQEWLKAGGHRYNDAHNGAMHQVFTKLSRMAFGKIGHMDNYLDAAAYIAIAGQNVDVIDAGLVEDKTVSPDPTTRFVQAWEATGDPHSTPGRFIAQGELPEGVNSADARVQLIVAKCKKAWSL